MSPSQPAILLLMADARLRDIYSSRFEKGGWAVETAATLLDAERRAVQLRPSVLVVDVSLLEDVKLGFKRFKSLPTLLKCQLVLLARSLPRSQIDEALAAGAKQVVLTAHLTPQEFVTKMTQLIED